MMITFSKNFIKIIFKKNYLLLVLSTILPILCSCRAVVKPLAGAFHHNPQEAQKKLSPQAKKLIDQAFTGINLACFQDFHIHSVGIGTGGTGAWVNPKMTNWFNPKLFLKYNAYLSAAGIQELEKTDQQYAQRLLALINSDKRYRKAVLLAFDYHYSKDGKKIEDKSSFYIPTEYVIQQAQQSANKLIPAASVHPYKPNATQELEKYARQGIRYVKWLPNSQHIDPSDPMINSYYEIMTKYNMVLISHTGHEKAVEGEEYQRLGNPLRLKKPLSKGVKVIMAHMASLGKCEDLDRPGSIVPCFDLYWRMMNNPKWKGLLFGELSATTIYTRFGNPLKKLLENPNLHKRFVHGSDYPLPAINILYQTSQYQKMGYITKEERLLLNEIYRYNPILFDFVTKRTLKHPRTKKKLTPEAFEYPQELGCLKKQ